MVQFEAPGENVQRSQDVIIPWRRVKSHRRKVEDHALDELQLSSPGVDGDDGIAMDASETKEGVDLLLGSKLDLDVEGSDRDGVEVLGDSSDCCEIPLREVGEDLSLKLGWDGGEYGEEELGGGTEEEGTKQVSS